jgi:hypothetical protein
MNACVHTDTKPQISSTRSRGLGWRIHGSVEDTKLSTNKQHTLSLYLYSISFLTVPIFLFWSHFGFDTLFGLFVLLVLLEIRIMVGPKSKLPQAIMTFGLFLHRRECTSRRYVPKFKYTILEGPNPGLPRRFR